MSGIFPLVARGVARPCAPSSTLLSAALFVAISLAAPAQARPAAELSCIEAMFDEDDFRAMAQMSAGSPDEAAAAQEKVDFFQMGMSSRMCALRGHWSEAEYGNAVAYMVAWPTMRGLRLQGEGQGYAAIDRAFAPRAAALAKKERLSDAEKDAVLDAARGDGLALTAGDAALTTARRYVDVLQQVARFRADFEAGRKPKGLK